MKYRVLSIAFLAVFLVSLTISSPLIENMFVGPFIGIDTESSVFYGAGLSVLF